LVEKVESRATTLQDLDKLEEWEDQNLIKSNKDKCQVLSMGTESPCHNTIQGQSDKGAAL